MDELPDWALKHLPVKHPQAAMLLGVSERKLWTIVGEHPHFERRGRANLYYPEHIEALRKVMSEAGERSIRGAKVAEAALERERRKRAKK